MRNLNSFSLLLHTGNQVLSEDIPNHLVKSDDLALLSFLRVFLRLTDVLVMLNEGKVQLADVQHSGFFRANFEKLELRHSVLFLSHLPNIIIIRMDYNLINAI